jgi:cold-inducible RNA-binding protein
MVGGVECLLRGQPLASRDRLLSPALYSPENTRQFKKPTAEVNMKNIYVGNLPFDANEEELQAAFEAHGKVDKVTVVRDRDTGQPRGFAFVEMANDGEAEKAMATLNGSALRGRTLNVNEARPRVERGPGGGGGRDSRGGGRGGRGGRGGGGGGYGRY